MNKQQRLKQLVEKMQQLNGISDDKYQEIAKLLASKEKINGFDASGRLNIALFDAKSYDIESFERINEERFRLIPIATKLDENSVMAANDCKVVCIFVNDKCDETVVKKLAAIGVKLIALRCAGFNNVDLNAAKKHGLQVVRVPAYSPHAVAEHTIALILMLNRNLHRAYMRNRAGQFVLDGLVGFDMHGKTVGVIGTGKIGQCVIEILLGFGCNILAYDKFPNKNISKNAKVEYVSIEDLQKRSDIITLHAPLLEDTKHIINKQSIKLMKHGVMLINTSRGALVDTRALIDGLKSKKISAAGLDVYEEESDLFFRDMSDDIINDEVFARLLTFNNVVITSHQAFLTKEALSNIAQTTLDNIQEYQDASVKSELTNAVTAD